MVPRLRGDDRRQGAFTETIDNTPHSDAEDLPSTVIPTKVGIQRIALWFPAYARMTGDKAPSRE